MCAFKLFRHPIPAASHWGKHHSRGSISMQMSQRCLFQAQCMRRVSSRISGRKPRSCLCVLRTFWLLQAVAGVKLLQLARRGAGTARVFWVWPRVRLGHTRPSMEHGPPGAMRPCRVLRVRSCRVRACVRARRPPLEPRSRAMQFTCFQAFSVQSAWPTT